MKQTPLDVLQATVQAMAQHGSQRRAAKALGISQSMVSERLAAARARGIYVEKAGAIGALESRVADLPPSGRKHVYILTSAQNHTRLHAACWRNLLALAAHDHATIMVSTFKYNKDALGQRANAKWETREEELAAGYPAELLEKNRDGSFKYICDDRVDIAPNISFCGELNVLPTAVNPLEGLESYTYRKSTIVPHPKLALDSVPSMHGEGVKLMVTTGCVTQRNYIKRKVGYKAEAFHTYGALLLEVDDAGSWWFRHLVHGPDGAIHDLDRRVKDGTVTTGHHVEDICWGDAHVAKRDPAVAAACWSTDKHSMLETLRPRSQHVHDLLDFSGRSHHTRKDPHKVFANHLSGDWLLTEELAKTARELWFNIARPWCQTVVVNSNHDRHLERWLKEMDWREDPANARLILALNLDWLNAIADKRSINMPEHALRYGLDYLQDEPGTTGPVRFLGEDESDIILPKIDGGIQAGLHGDRGANGAKGSITGMAQIDRKVNAGDKHTAAIKNHAYFAGTTALLQQGWNHGLTSWTHANIVTYPNGTRTIVSVWKGKWRA